MTKFRVVFKPNGLPNYLIIFLLLLITALGGFLRFYNLNWDMGLSFHPDERNMAAAVSRISFFDQLNPQFFAYGGFLIYLYRALGELISFLSNDPSWVSSWGKINLIGRFVSAWFSTITIPVIYILTKKLFDRSSIALLASLITALCVSFIQTAHYGITESLLVFLVVLLCFTSLLIRETPSFKSYLFSGIVLGISVATKVSGLSFIIFPLMAHLLFVFSKPLSVKLFFRRSLLFFAFLIISGLVFVTFSPYTLLDWGKFMESMRYESGVAMGRFSVPYTLQFTHTTPYLFQLKNFLWQLGPVALFSVFGFIVLPFVSDRENTPKLLLFFPFPTVYFLYVGSWYTKFIRFMVPILPFLIIAASFLLFYLQSKKRLIGNLLIFLVLSLTFLWALAFFSIYRQEQTRIVASKWIYQHIPSDSRILGEHWDDGLPVSLSHLNLTSYRYRIEQLTIYEPDNEEKIRYYAEELFDSDYIVINSRRLYGTLIHLDDKYPLTSRYYQLLFSGGLGYEKVAEFASYPSLLGIKIKDDSSEETFQVYDHPKVMIFAKTTPMSRDRLTEVLAGDSFFKLQ